MGSWDYIYEVARDFLDRKGARIAHVVRRIVVVLLIAALAEVFVFNFNHFRTAGYDTVNLDSQVTLYENDSPNAPSGLDSYDQFIITEQNRVVEFHHLNKKVQNIYLAFDNSQSAQNVDVKINFTDGAHSTYFDSTEYTEGIPTATVATNCLESKYINLNTAGYTQDVRIEFSGENLNYPIYLNGIYINAVEPFSFNTMRFALLAIALGLFYVFRPKSSIYSCYMKERPRKSKIAIIATVAVEIYLMTAFCLMGSNLVGVATQQYNPGSWDKKSIVNVFEVGGDNAQQYAELAKSMAEGHLYLDETPPAWLQTMDDPYDKGSRDELQKQTGEEYLFDVAYYDGKYYVYFGVVPVIVFYLPFYLLTGANFPTALGIILACAAFVVGLSALLDRFARYHFKRVSLGLYLLLQIPLIMCCGVLYLLKFPTFYSMPIMLGLAFTVWGLYFWMRGRAAKKKAAAWFFFGSLCMACVFGCRPQLGLLSLLAFPLFWRPFITERRLFSRKGALEFACLVGPYVLVGGGIMLYNYARFGSVTNFGANYNLTVNDMTKRGTNIGRVWPALFAYFLQTPSTTGVFPFIQAAPFETTYMGQTIKETTFGGILACLPLLWILPFSKRILQMRFKQRSTKTIAGVIMVMLFSAIVVALLDAEMAGILQRYYADFSFMFLVPVILLIFIVNENLDHDSKRFTLLLKVLITLVFFSVLYELLLCFVPETGWYSDAYPWAYQSILETFLFWT